MAAVSRSAFKSGCRSFWEWSHLEMNCSYVSCTLCKHAAFWRVWCRGQFNPKEEGHPKKWCKYRIGLLCFTRPYSVSLLTSSTFFNEVIMSWEMVGRTEINTTMTEFILRERSPKITEAQYHSGFNWRIQLTFKDIAIEVLFQLHKDQCLVTKKTQFVNYSELKKAQLGYCIVFAVCSSFVHA